MDLKSLILSAKDNAVTPVEVPDWGCTVYVRTLSEGDVQKAVENSTDSYLMCLSAADENGNRLFQDSDLEALKTKPFKIVRQISLAAMKHNSMFGEADGAAKNS